MAAAKPVARVAVIGSGISGLSCAHLLTSKGFFVKVFEKEMLAGGRAPKAIRTISYADTNVLSLLRQIGFSNLDNVKLNKFGSLNKGKMTPFSRFKAMILTEDELCPLDKIMRHIGARITKVDLKELNRFQRHVDSLKFSLGGKENHEVLELHDMSMQQWMSEYSQSLQNAMVVPVLMTTFESDFTKLSARYGVHQIQKYSEIVRKGGYMVLGGPFEITSKIIADLRKRGNAIEFLAEVEAIEEAGDGYSVIYKKIDKLSEEKEIWGKLLKMVRPTTEKFDYVVLATPLPVTSKILKKDFRFPYLETKAIYTKGEIKQKGIDIVVGPDYVTNFRAMYTLLTSNEQSIYPIDPKLEIKDLDKIFKGGDYSILHIEGIPMAMPRMVPKQRVPSLEFDKKGIFICGDFYHYPTLDTAVYTGLRVAQKIIDKHKKGPVPGKA